jgi:hypothetical protein
MATIPLFSAAARNYLTVYHCRRRRVVTSHISQLIYSENPTSNMCPSQRRIGISSPRTRCHTPLWCADSMKSYRRVLEKDRSDDFLLLRNGALRSRLQLEECSKRSRQPMARECHSIGS